LARLRIETLRLLTTCSAKHARRWRTGRRADKMRGLT